MAIFLRAGQVIETPVNLGIAGSDPRDARMNVLIRDKALLERFNGEDNLKNFLNKFFDGGVDVFYRKLYERFRGSQAVYFYLKNNSSGANDFVNPENAANIVFVCRRMSDLCGIANDGSFDVPQRVLYKGKEYVFPGLDSLVISESNVVNGENVFWGYEFSPDGEVSGGRCFSSDGKTICSFGYFEVPKYCSVDGYDFLAVHRDTFSYDYLSSPIVFFDEKGNGFFTCEDFSLIEKIGSQKTVLSVFVNGKWTVLSGEDLKNLNKKFLDSFTISQKRGARNQLNRFTPKF